MQPGGAQGLLEAVDGAGGRGEYVVEVAGGGVVEHAFGQGGPLFLLAAPVEQVGAFNSLMRCQRWQTATSGGSIHTLEPQSGSLMRSVSSQSWDLSPAARTWTRSGSAMTTSPPLSCSK